MLTYYSGEDEKPSTQKELKSPEKSAQKDGEGSQKTDDSSVARSDSGNTEKQPEDKTGLETPATSAGTSEQPDSNQNANWQQQAPSQAQLATGTPQMNQYSQVNQAQMPQMPQGFPPMQPPPMGTAQATSVGGQQMVPPPAMPQPPQVPPQMPPSNVGKDHGKMFIGGLNWDTSEQGLVDYFSQFGEVVDYTIMRDNATGKSRGFGFLTFKDPKSVEEVIKRDHILDGKLIDPKRAIAREEQDKVGKIFVGGIDPMVNEKEFHDFFSQFGSIIDAQLMIDKDTGRSRGFGFITYDSPDAVDRVTVNKYLTLKGKSMEVKRAEPRGQHQQNQLQQQQQQQQQQYNYGMYGNQYGQMPYQGMAAYGQSMNGMSPEMMQEYWQRMQQWYMFQQQQQQQQQAGTYAQAPQGEQPEQPLNPQQQAASEPQDSQEQETPGSDSSGNHNNHQKRLNLPKGPRRAPPSGPSGSRNRGGYQNRNRGYHPYSRGRR